LSETFYQVGLWALAYAAEVEDIIISSLVVGSLMAAKNV